MNRLAVRVGLGLVAALAAAASLGWAGAAGTRLYVDGKTASTGLIVREGVTYVPLKDVASALSMTIEPRSDGYALVRPGGAGQIQGLTGKIGDDLFNGAFRLKVIEVVRGDSYHRRYSSGDDRQAPQGEELVTLIMRIKNGTQKTVSINPVGLPSAVTDMDEHAFEAYRFPDVSANTSEVLPGAAIDFGLTFHVAKGAVLKDLVYTVDCLGAKAGPAFRVSLKEPA